MLENCDKIMHFYFNFDACPMHSVFGFVHLTHQNLSMCVIFCHNSLAKVNTQLLGRMRTPVREAFSYGIRHRIRHIHCDSMKHKVILH